MDRKILWIDTETGGLDAANNALLQVAMMVEINGEVKDTFSIKLLPFPGDEVTPEALQISNINPQDGGCPQNGFIQMIKFMGKYVNCYDRYDKYIPAGYNLSFDLGFLDRFFRRCKNNFLYSYLLHKSIDVYSIMRYLQMTQIINITSVSLEEVSKYFGIIADGTFHDALTDIKMTREINLRLIEALKVISIHS